MSYPEFNPLRPDPTTDNGSDAFTVTRENLLALRDGLLSGGMAGWSLALSGGTAARPTTWTYSKGAERVRVVMTWGTAGGNAGKPTALTISYSSNSGGDYDTIDSATLSYDSAGNLTGVSGMAPGLATSWLLGMPERVRVLEESVTSHTGASNPHSGSASVSALNAHAAAEDGVHGIPAGEGAWHTGNLTPEAIDAAAAEHTHSEMAHRNRATVVQIRGLTGDAGLTSERLAAAAEVVVFPGTSNLTPAWGDFINASWEVTADRTLGNPTGVVPGTTRRLTISSSSATARTITLGSAYKGLLPPIVPAGAKRFTLYLDAITASHIVVSAVEWST